MSPICKTTLPPGSVALMSPWTIFWTSSDQGSWVFRESPTLLEMSTIALQMNKRVIPWCTELKYKRWMTVQNMQMASGCSPQNFEGENLNTGRKYSKTSILMCEMTVTFRLKLNFTGNQPWECWKTTWMMRVWVLNILSLIRRGIEGMLSWGMILWVGYRVARF